MNIYKVTQNGKSLSSKREVTFFIALQEPQVKQEEELTVLEKPKVAINPPWDGGLLGKDKMAIHYSLMSDWEQVYGGLIKITCMMK
jgi:hypothetical protein